MEALLGSKSFCLIRDLERMTLKGVAIRKHQLYALEQIYRHVYSFNKRPLGWFTVEHRDLLRKVEMRVRFIIRSRGSGGVRPDVEKYAAVFGGYALKDGASIVHKRIFRFVSYGNPEDDIEEIDNFFGLSTELDPTLCIMTCKEDAQRWVVYAANEALSDRSKRYGF